MAAPYIPPKDADLDAWLTNFSTLITASPATYGLVASDATAIATQVANWTAAYTPVLSPSSKTKTAVADKNSAKIAATTLCRTYAAQIRLNPGVSNMNKVALGLNLPNNAPSPVPAPSTFPLLTLASAGPLLHVLRFADNTTPASRKKPAGALQMELWRGTGTAPLTSPSQCALFANVTKQPFQADFESGDGGKMATYFARWVTRTGLTGPWSAAVSLTVPVSG